MEVIRSVGVGKKNSGAGSGSSRNILEILRLGRAGLGLCERDVNRCTPLCLGFVG